MSSNTTLNPIRCSSLCEDNLRIVHGFYTRSGGYSNGIYESLNAGPGSRDDPEKVRLNRQAIVRNLGLDGGEIVTSWQIHSADVVVASKPWGTDKPKADAVVTRAANLPIGVVTADCGPVLFCDAENKVIGAAHAGWKGATSGILENTIETMIKEGARLEGIRATLGPTISGKSYEVGPEFVDNLLSMNATNRNYLSSSLNKGHANFDLPAYIVNRLKKAGVQANSLDICTYQDEKRFFSYRRMTHRGEADYGRQISVIAIVDNDH
jgi:YfiH family protein